MSTYCLKEEYLDFVIDKICASSHLVDKLNIKSKDGIIIAVFKADDGIKVAKITKEEIKNRIKKENVLDDNIKDFIIDLISKKLINSIIVNGSNNIKKAIKKQMLVNQTINDILDMLFPDD